MEISQPGGSGGVTSINSLTGAVTLAAGTGISLGTVGNTITINASGVSGVTSFAKQGSTALTGAVTISGGTNVTLTQTGQNISIVSAGGASAGDAFDVQRSNGSGGFATSVLRVQGGGILMFAGSINSGPTGGGGMLALYGIANGSYSLAMGYQKLGGGDNATASAQLSIAIGASALASGIGSLALGYNSTASADYAVSIGGVNVSSATYAFSSGQGTTASGVASNAINSATLASGDYSFSGGLTSVSSGDKAFSFGGSAYAQADYAVSFGNGNVSSGLSAFTSGEAGNAAGYASVTMGLSTSSFGYTGFSGGNNTHASGNYSTVFGFHTRAGYAPRTFTYNGGEGTINISGDVTAEFNNGDTVNLQPDNFTPSQVGTISSVPSYDSGSNTTSFSLSEGVSGITGGLIAVTSSSTYQFVAGKYNITDNVSAFIIGNGTDEGSRSNAYTLDFSGNSAQAGNATILGLTASMAVATNGGSTLVSSTTTDTELGYLSGASSNIQNQLNNLITLASVDLATQSAAIGTTTLYAPPSAGMYRITVYLQVTRAATTSSILGGAGGVVIAYKDGDGNVTQTDTVALMTAAGTIAISAAGNTTTTNLSGSLEVYANSGANITYAIGYTSVGVTSMQFAAHLRVEKI